LGNTFLSADGSVLADTSASESGYEQVSYRWTKETGPLAVFTGTRNEIVGLSDDGSVIAASVELNGTSRTVVWDEAHGTRPVQETLELQGVDTSDWIFTTPRVLSADGKVLIGNALCRGVPALYRIALPD
jgi:hypothetical protein